MKPASLRGLEENLRTIMRDPLRCKKLKGNLSGMRCYKYSVKGQERRLIPEVRGNNIYLLSFGPREGIYK